MNTPRRTLAAVLLCLSTSLCLLLCACKDDTGTPADTTSSGETVPVTDSAPESSAESDGETLPESAEETTAQTLPESEPAGETAPERETEDPALNVFPTDGEIFDIGIFFEPDAEHSNAEHFDWIKAANITYIDSVNWDKKIDREITLRQAQLAAERGIRFSYYPPRFGVSLTSMSTEKLTEYCQELMALGDNIRDLHVIDEPANPWAYAEIMQTVHAAGMTPRLNFLPKWAPLFQTQNYRGHIEDTIIAVGKDIYPDLYFDEYPYDKNHGSTPDMFNNFNIIREIGLKYGVDTGFYIQSCGDHAVRRPNANEIRYQISAGLAYGYKSMTYFTWWTTSTETPEDLYAIISPFGEKTDLYDAVVEINAQVATTGPLLTRLDALEVYHTAGKETGIVLATAEELPLFPTDAKRFGFVVSLMEDRETGRDYILLVNKNFKQNVTTPITVTDKISFLYNCTNGAYEEIDISTGSFEMTFAPGGYALLALGQKDNVVERKLDVGNNLAEEKTVSVEAVNPGQGYYAFSVTDGVRDDRDPQALGYRSPANTGSITVDLGRSVLFNRVDLYPAGTSINTGAAFPRDFTIDVSADGETWETLLSETDYDCAGGVSVFTFNTMRARYVRLNVTEGSSKGYFEIAEIEIYNDKGNIPLPDNQTPDLPDYDPSGNIATAEGVQVICSSAYEEGTFWRIAGINDGRIMDVVAPEGTYCGWSSNVFVHTEQASATEWIGYDFGKPVTVNTLIAHPAQNSQSTPQGFPLSYCVEVSDDGINWRSVYEIEDDPQAGEFIAHTIRFDPVTTRFIRFRGTKLTTVGPDALFGYMMQMSEIEVIAG